jgi:WD40 repeat protein
VRIAPDFQSRAFPARGRVVAVALDPCDDRHCLVWRRAWALVDSADFAVLADAENPACEFSCATWNPGVPGQFATGEESGVIRVWQGSSAVPVGAFVGVRSAGVAVIVILAGFSDGLVKVYDLKSRVCRLENVAGHGNTIFSIRWAEPDVLATAGGEGAICFWNASDFTQIGRIQQRDGDPILYSMDIAGDGRKIACGYGDGTLVIFERSGVRLNSLQIAQGKILSVSIGINGILCVADSGPPVLFADGITRWESVEGILVGRAMGVDKWAIAGKDGKVGISNGRKIKWLQTGAGEAVYQLEISPHKSECLATADDGGFIRIWDTNTSRSSIVGRQRGKARALAFHPVFSDIIVSGGFEGYLMVHSIAQERVICAVPVSIGIIYSLSRENPHLLVSSGSDLVIRFWSLDRIFMRETVSRIAKCDMKWIRPLEGYRRLLKFARGDNSNILCESERKLEKLLGRSPNFVQRERRLARAARIELYRGNVKGYVSKICPDWQVSTLSKLIELIENSCITFEREFRSVSPLKY